MLSLYKVIEKELQPIAEEFGCSIVQVSLRSSVKKKTLQIMIERLDDLPVSIEDCEKTSRAFSVTLDVLDLIKGRYFLEVSSPGLDRPLVHIKDYYRFVGKRIVVGLYEPINNQRIFKGLLESATEDGIVLLCDASGEFDQTSVEISYDVISSANIDGSFL